MKSNKHAASPENFLDTFHRINENHKEKEMSFNQQHTFIHSFIETEFVKVGNDEFKTFANNGMLLSAPVLNNSDDVDKKILKEDFERYITEGSFYKDMLLVEIPYSMEAYLKVQHDVGDIKLSDVESNQLIEFGLPMKGSNTGPNTRTGNLVCQITDLPNGHIQWLNDRSDTSDPLCLAMRERGGRLSREGSTLVSIPKDFDVMKHQSWCCVLFPLTYGTSSVTPGRPLSKSNYFIGCRESITINIFEFNEYVKLRRGLKSNTILDTLRDKIATKIECNSLRSIRSLGVTVDCKNAVKGDPPWKIEEKENEITTGSSNNIKSENIVGNDMFRHSCARFFAVVMNYMMESVCVPNVCGDNETSGNFTRGKNSRLRPSAICGIFPLCYDIGVESIPVEVATLKELGECINLGKISEADSAVAFIPITKSIMEIDVLFAYILGHLEYPFRLGSYTEEGFCGTSTHGQSRTAVPYASLTRIIGPTSKIILVVNCDVEESNDFISIAGMSFPRLGKKGIFTFDVVSHLHNFLYDHSRWGQLADVMVKMLTAYRMDFGINRSDWNAAKLVVALTSTRASFPDIHNTSYVIPREQNMAKLLTARTTPLGDVVNLKTYKRLNYFCQCVKDGDYSLPYFHQIGNILRAFKLCCTKDSKKVIDVIGPNLVVLIVELALVATTYTDLVAQCIPIGLGSWFINSGKGTNQLSTSNWVRIKKSFTDSILESITNNLGVAGYVKGKNNSVVPDTAEEFGFRLGVDCLTAASIDILPFARTTRGYLRTVYGVDFPIDSNCTFLRPEPHLLENDEIWYEIDPNNLNNSSTAITMMTRNTHDVEQPLPFSYKLKSGVSVGSIMIPVTKLNKHKETVFESYTSLSLCSRKYKYIPHGGSLVNIDLLSGQRVYLVANSQYEDSAWPDENTLWRPSTPK